MKPKVTKGSTASPAPEPAGKSELVSFRLSADHAKALASAGTHGESLGGCAKRIVLAALADGSGRGDLPHVLAEVVEELGHLRKSVRVAGQKQASGGEEVAKGLTATAAELRKVREDVATVAVALLTTVANLEPDAAAAFVQRALSQVDGAKQERGNG